jgi:hypothetical protein
MPFPHASQALSRFTVLDLTRVRSGRAERSGARLKTDSLTGPVETQIRGRYRSLTV